ncbi:hypothetical protein ACFFX1_50065 [Dactylosporangium sucinum]|uniref:Uncharacterized protein n=1 Tax=Dactylosporangium sucinum TaxID=1424081 RepID=A0A917UB19_9ACTN|nr:hypothetical protein [Dactylosporangium sucinum]GGM65946.1 hypothetical protein GCM10007977_079440 [Dactylosporangium sucinum]
MDNYWRRCHSEIATVKARSLQFLVLERYAGRHTATKAGYDWWALSRAGHHHCYELGLTAGELHRLREVVAAVITDLDNAGAAPIDV